MAYSILQERVTWLFAEAFPGTFKDSPKHGHFWNVQQWQVRINSKEWKVKLARLRYQDPEQETPTSCWEK